MSMKEIKPSPYVKQKGLVYLEIQLIHRDNGSGVR